MCQPLSAGTEELIPMMLACFLLMCLLTFTFCSGMIAQKNLGMQTSNYLEISVLQGQFVYFKADTEKQNRIQNPQPFLLGELSFLHVWLLVKHRSMSPGLAKLSPSHGNTKPFNTQLCGMPIKLLLMSGWCTSQCKTSMRRHAVRPSVSVGSPVKFFCLWCKRSEHKKSAHWGRQCWCCCWH